MAEKRKRPIAPTAKPGEEAAGTQADIASERGSRGTGGGHMHQVELEGEETELRQQEIPEAYESHLGGADVPEEDLTKQIDVAAQAQLPETDEEFKREIRELDPERQRESIMKRKRAS